MSRLQEVYNSYADGGFGSYTVPMRSESLLKDYRLNYQQLLPKDRDAQILDIGCGAGHFVLWLGGLGYQNVLGIDMSEAAIEHCHTHGLKNVELIGDLASFLESRSEQFDIVTMNDVIEHIPHGDMLQILTLVRKSLRQSGGFIIKTLNMGNPGGLYLRYADFTHFVGFTETSLRQVLLSAGFAKVIVRPYKIPTSTMKRRLWVTVRRLWSWCLNVILLLELGTDRPTILSKTLLAVAAV